MPPTFLDSSWPDLEGKIAPESIELTDFEISSFFGPICQDFWQAFLIWIAPAPVLLLELERLYESCGIRPWGRSTFPGAEPPAGPPKFSKSLGESTFPKNLDFLEASPNLSSKRDFSRTHIQTHRLHSWIGLDLRKKGKLLRSQWNSQILRNLTFSDLFAKIFDKHIWSEFPMRLYYS